MPLDDIRDNTGNVWKLGWKAPDSNQLRMRAARTSIQQWRVNNNQSELLPRSKWKEIDMVTGYPTDLIEDQGQIGSCSAFTATGAINRIRCMRGQAYERLSGFWLYDQCNSGRDNGSNIGEINEVVRRTGIPPMSAYTKCLWRADQNPTGVPYYKEEDEITVDTFDSIATLVIGHGGIAQIPVDANNMQRFDGNGVGIGDGSSPNHSIYVCGFKYIGSTWYAIAVTSWRLQFGPFHNGSWLLTERQINNCADANDGNGHIVTLDPTNSPTAPIPV